MINVIYDEPFGYIEMGENKYRYIKLPCRNFPFTEQFCLQKCFINALSFYAWYGVISFNKNFDRLYAEAKKIKEKEPGNIKRKFDNFLKRERIDLRVEIESFIDGNDENLYLAPIDEILRQGIPIIAIYNVDIEEAEDEPSDSYHSIVLCGRMTENFIVWDPNKRRYPYQKPIIPFEEGWSTTRYTGLYLYRKKLRIRRKVIKGPSLERWIR